MIRAERLFAKIEDAAEMQFSVNVIALRFAEQAKIVDGGGNTRVAWRKSLLANFERAFIERFCLGVFAFVAVKLCEVIQSDGQVGMLRPKRLFLDRNCARVQLFSILVAVH